MFELFFDHKCRNCGNVMEVGFVTTEYGDKDGVFYPGDYICDKDISHYKSVYMLQVVGHTPVEFVVKEGNLLTLDNFSTYRNGEPIGDERFVCVDTITMEYEMID